MPTLVIGLTGGIGAGKSTVAGLLGERGAQVIDVDRVGRAVLEPGGGAHKGVVDAFGTAVLDTSGAIDRAALAALVFGTDDRLAELEAISHPAINTRLQELLDATGDPIVVLDMAVLTESRLGHTARGRMYHRVMVVETPLDIRLPRLVERGMTEAEARDRMAAQASDAARRRLADLVVPNGGTQEDLRHTVALLWPTIEAWATQVGEGEQG